MGALLLLLVSNSGYIVALSDFFAMYRVSMPNQLRYTLVAILFTAAIGSVLLAKQSSFHWYTWTALAVFLIGTGPLLLENIERHSAHGWFYNWLASARRRPRLRYCSITMLIVAAGEQLWHGTTHGGMVWYEWTLIGVLLIALFRFTWPLPQPLPKTS